MKAKSRRKRESNLELFRILCMLLIIAHHMVVNSGLHASAVVNVKQNTLRSMWVLFLGAWGKTGINCFVLITGFFMYKAHSYVTKYVKLVFEVMFYNIAIFLIFLKLGYENLNFETLSRVLLFSKPESGRFVSTFLMFYLFIPFINILIRHISKREHLLLLCIFLYVYTIRGNIPYLEIPRNYISWFTVIYLTGAFLGKYYDELPAAMRNPGWLTLMFICCVILSASTIIVWAKYFTESEIYLSYYMLSDSNKILPYLSGMVAFLLFKSLNIRYSPMINLLGGSTFGVLLIHANCDSMRDLLWNRIIKINDIYLTSKIFYMPFVVVFLIFAVCISIDILRKKYLEEPLFQYLKSPLDSWEIKAKKWLLCDEVTVE